MNSVESSLITDIFRGQTMSITKCNNCYQKFYNFELPIVISLPIPKNEKSVKLRECLKEFSKEEEIKEFKCDSCKQNKGCTKWVSIWQFPHVLILQLKRFDSSNCRVDKVETSVDLPINLDLSEFRGESSNL